MNFTESDTLELKSELIPDICKEVIAFANSHGGMIYIGMPIIANTPEEQVIAYIREHGSITRPEAQSLLQVSQATADRLLKRMLAQGSIRQEGAGRGTQYTQ